MPEVRGPDSDANPGARRGPESVLRIRTWIPGQPSPALQRLLRTSVPPCLRGESDREGARSRAALSPIVRMQHGGSRDFLVSRWRGGYLRPMRRARSVCIVTGCLAACTPTPAAAPQPSAPSAAIAASSSAGVPAPEAGAGTQADEADLRRELSTTHPAVLPSAPTASPAPPCAEVQIGLDLRALPTRTSSRGIDLFVAAQTGEFEDKAPPGTPLRFLHWPGLGLFQASFDDPDPKAALARCEATVTRYLASAPRLPVIHQPAARVASPCKPCSP